jgi:hypothetical protein
LDATAWLSDGVVVSVTQFARAGIA